MASNEPTRIPARRHRSAVIAALVVLGAALASFRAVRTIGGRQTTITGVVLGQPGADQIAAGLMAARSMVDRIAGR